ncbi:MAG: ATP-dependent helicase, partial [Chloroflexi bacterium]|nr:ATP-dependent helicase [Chloroflexota bacterium]
LDAGRPQVIGEVDRETAPIFVHEGAVYLHEGRQFLVETLDWENGLAQVQATEVDYYTRASESAELDVTGVSDADESRPARRAWGTVLVRSRATGYRQIRRYTHETLGYGPIDLPERVFETTGYWLWLADETVEQLQIAGIMLRPNDYGPN